MKSILLHCFSILMVAQGTLWAVMGLLRLSGGPETITLLMFLNASFFIVFAFLYRKTRLLNVLAGVFLAGNLILSLTDQTGALDILVFALDAACIVLLTAGLKPRESRKIK